MTQPAIEYVQGVPICHEPNEPANCESTARAINDSIASHDFSCDRRAVMVRVAVIDDDDAAFPVGVCGCVNDVSWRATLTQTQCNNMQLDDAKRLVWWLYYEVEPRG